MKNRNILIVFAAVLLLGAGTIANASSDEDSAIASEEAALQAQLEAEYEKAMSEAERQRMAAESSMEKAREQLQQAAEQRKMSARQSVEAQSARAAEMEKMHEELNQTRRQLQETSREIARVNREVARARSLGHTEHYVIRSSDTPVIGVILGDSDKSGVEVLGVSPDGPSERAGIKKGDTIIAVEGQKLSEIGEVGDAGDALRLALGDVEADEPVLITIKRDNRSVDLSVVPEIRRPLSWHSVTRFPTAPSAPHAATAPERVISIERIVVPELDTVEMTVQVEQMRADIERLRSMREAGRVEPAEGEWEIQLHEMSELGHFALEDANVWFGLPMAQGLQLAVIDPGLGEYFKTDRGVLVLKARTDNDLQLESGDVILQVGGTEVNSPAEFMRALRDLNSGEELVMDIKRHRKDRTLKIVMPEDRASFQFPVEGKTSTFTITSSH
jgi:outer membrane murein-binding lipoprotein Lpp